MLTDEAGQGGDCYVLCPYCDPNHSAYPNLDEACRGYDVPMGNPVPAQVGCSVNTHCKVW